MTEDRFMNFLSIRERGKGVPYGPGAPREDGSCNHGFKPLKGNLHDLGSIPELTDDLALREVVAAINAPETSLFSTGCLSGPVHEEQGHRRTGYVEFALNSMSLVQDAQNYFPVFFWFNKALHGEQFARAKFDWELEGASFLDAGGVGGFTCAVFVNTPFTSTEDLALSDWRAAMELLGGYLHSVRNDATDYIYPPTPSS